MRTYSLDLRTRIVEAVESGDHTIREVAEIFNVHETFIYKLLRQKRERGDIAPLPHGGGHEAKLSKEHLQILSNLVSQTPDATLEELREQIRKKTRVEVGITTIWRSLEALNISRKKSPARRPKPIQSKGQISRGSKKGSP
jgi:transposase